MIEGIFNDLLSGLDEQGQDESPEDWEERVSAAIFRLRDSYENLTVQGRNEIDYSSIATQAAYVFAYAIGRAEFTYQMLMRHRIALGEPIFPNPIAKITSLGGGPGSEIAGIVKYLCDPQSGENVESIKYWVFDKDGEWSHACQSVVDGLNEIITIDLEYAKMDLADNNECIKISLQGDDMLVLSFVISELCALDTKVQILENLRYLYGTLDFGAKIFYNDSRASSFYYFFNESKTYVRGFGRVSQKSEVVERIAIDLNFGDVFENFIEEYGSTPHLNSDALSKLLVRCR